MAKFEPVGEDDLASVGELDPARKRELAQVAPSLDAGLVPQYPVRLTYSDGRVLERVLLVNAAAAYGLHMWRGPVERFTTATLEGVAQIEASPHRLPAAIANLVYFNSSERNMGTFEFALRFADGRRLLARPGNRVDYLALPVGFDMKDIDTIELNTQSDWDGLEVVAAAQTDVVAFL